MDQDWDKARGDVGELSPEFYHKSIDEINGFFDSEIIPNLINSRWDLCINVVRNGESIFNEQVRRNMNSLNQKDVINDNEISKFPNKIRSKRILLFDDSIKNGITIEHAIKKILPYEPNCISIATILCPVNLLDQIRHKYPQVKEIISTYKVQYSGDRHSEIDYKHALRIVEAYSKYTCFPNQDGKIHPYILIKTKQKKGRKVIENLKYYSEKSVSNISDLFSFIDRDNISICLKKCVLDAILIESELEDVCIGSVFIRIFLREDAQKLIIQPIIRNYEEISSDAEEDVKEIDLKIKCALLKFIVRILDSDYIQYCKICIEREFIHEA